MNIIYVSCVEIGFDCLSKILENNYTIKGLITLEKKRGSKTSGFVDFSDICKNHNIEMVSVVDINSSEVVSKVSQWQADIMIVCGWQRLLGTEILSSVSWGVIGAHSSLLPNYRGRAPVNWAIINGEKETGVTVFKMDASADTGSIIEQTRFDIASFDTCHDVYRKSAKATAGILLKALPMIMNGKSVLRKNESAQYPCMPKRTPEDGLIDWGKSAIELHNWVRALTHPYPGAFTYLFGVRLFIWEAVALHPELDVGLEPGDHKILPGLGVVFCCRDGGLLVTKAQFEGREEKRPDIEKDFFEKNDLIK